VRHFKVPGGMAGAWVVGIAGALSCLYVMWGLPKDTWLRLIIWMEIGLLIYAGFGWRKSRLANPAETPSRAGMHKPILVAAIVTFIPTIYFAIRVFGKGQ
jgi:hypothetical protein